MKEIADQDPWVGILISTNQGRDRKIIDSHARVLPDANQLLDHIIINF